MEPLSTSGGIDLSAPHVIAVVLAATLVAIVAWAVHRVIQAYGDELAALWHEYGPLAVGRLLDRRRMAATPWFCARCRSHNARAHTRCYACGAHRDEAEAPVPGAEVPSGQGGGREHRTRR